MTLLLYGANGYTGELIAREAVRRFGERRGLSPSDRTDTTVATWSAGINPAARLVVAGRNGPAIAKLAGELGLEHRVFDVAEADRGLDGISVVLNCAGPFSRTAAPIVDACLRRRVHYLDITGEESVFEAIARRDAEAKSAGVTLLPGVGFDVVPSDCLAAHLKRRLPTATRLTLAFRTSGAMSRGTALTVVEGLADGGLIRKNGVLTKVPIGSVTRQIDFGDGPELTMRIPWGDVVTAFHSTGIRDIEVFMQTTRGTVIGANLSRGLGWLLRTRFVQDRLRRRVLAGERGPSTEQRARGVSVLWGEVVDDRGGRAVSRLRGPEGYAWTVTCALAVVKQVLAGTVEPGFRTPALAFGPDFVLGPGIERVDIDEPIRSCRVSRLCVAMSSRLFGGPVVNIGGHASLAMAPYGTQATSSVAAPYHAGMHAHRSHV